MKKLLKVVMMLTVAVSVVQASSVSIMKKPNGGKGLYFLNDANQKALAAMIKGKKALAQSGKQYKAVQAAVARQVEAALDKDAYKGNTHVEGFKNGTAKVITVTAKELKDNDLTAKNINVIEGSKGEITWVILDEFVTAMAEAEARGQNLSPVDFQIALAHEADIRFEKDEAKHIAEKERPEGYARALALAGKDASVFEKSSSKFHAINKDKKSSRLVILDPAGTLAKLGVAEEFTKRDFVIVQIAKDTKVGDRTVVLSDNKKLVASVKGQKIPLDLSGVKDGGIAIDLIQTAFVAAAVFYSSAYSVEDALEVYKALQIINNTGKINEEAFRRAVARARSAAGISIDDLMTYFAILPAEIQDLFQLSEQRRRIMAVGSKA